MTISISDFLIKEVNSTGIINNKITNKKTSAKKISKDHLRIKRLQDLGKEINWDNLVDVTFQYYLQSNIGRLIVPTQSMLKVYFLQYRYQMSAVNVEKALIEVDDLRSFALEIDVVPNASSIHAFACLLQDNKLTAKIETAFNLS